MSETRLTVSQFTALVGCSKSYVYRAIREGRVRRENGLIDPFHPLNRIFYTLTRQRVLQRGYMRDAHGVGHRRETEQGATG